MKYLLTISFLGTAYNGFQSQKDGNTVQDVLRLAGDRLFGGGCSVAGCSRTDSGVHANRFLATLKTPSGAIPDEKLPFAMNAMLPCDISVIHARSVCDEYHLHAHITGKEYLYRIWNSPVRNPFLSDRAFMYPYVVDMDRLRLSAGAVIGKKDFRAFMASGSSVTDTVRTVTDCRAEKHGDEIRIYVSADGFLYNMVRIIVGTVLKYDAGDVKKIILSLDRTRAGMTVPAGGLYLNRVFTDEGIYGDGGI